MRLSRAAALAEFGPVETLALLKHPLVTLGLDRAGLRRAAVIGSITSSIAAR